VNVREKRLKPLFYIESAEMGLGYPQSRDVARVLIWNARRKQLGFREEKVIGSLKPRRFSLRITII
jgi:hypothetical protein